MRLARLIMLMYGQCYISQSLNYVGAMFKSQEPLQKREHLYLLIQS